MIVSGSVLGDLWDWVVGVFERIGDVSVYWLALALALKTAESARLGTLLLEGITMRAREEGVDTFTAPMFVENGHMMHLLERLGAVRVVDRAAGIVDVEVHLPATPSVAGGSGEASSLA